MAFHVGFVDDIQSQAVTEPVEFRRIRIMRGPHGIDVITLHQQEVMLHLPDRRVISGVRVAVVAVHALEFHGSAVYLNYAVFYRCFTEAHLLVYHLVAGGNFQQIKLRSFRRPEPGSGNSDGSAFVFFR